MNQSSFIQLKMQAHLIFKVYQSEKCTQSRSSTLINFFNYLLEAFAGRTKVRHGPQFAHPWPTVWYEGQKLTIAFDLLLLL